MSQLSDLALVAPSAAAARPGVRTSEFKGKTFVQALLVLVLVLQRFGVDIALDEQTAIAMIAGLEATYTFARSAIKVFAARSPAPVA